MAKNTVTRAQLAESVYQQVGLSRNESSKLVESVLGEISDRLVAGETVKISSFGSFHVRRKTPVSDAIPRPVRKFPSAHGRCCRSGPLMCSKMKSMCRSVATETDSDGGEQAIA